MQFTPVVSGKHLRLIPADSGVISPEALKAANINPKTALATDYLNHFNEVIMLLDMVPSMPECVDDIIIWEPRSYCDHFRLSTFKDKDLAIRAYEQVPSGIKTHFEGLVASLDCVMLDVIADLKTAESEESLIRIAERGIEDLHPLISCAMGAINGVLEGVDQHPHHSFDEPNDAQAAIDAMF